MVMLRNEARCSLFYIFILLTVYMIKITEFHSALNLTCSRKSGEDGPRLFFPVFWCISYQTGLSLDAKLKLIFTLMFLILDVKKLVIICTQQPQNGTIFISKFT